MKKKIVYCLILAFALSVAACGNSNNTKEEKNEQTEQNQDALSLDDVISKAENIVGTEISDINPDEIKGLVDNSIANGAYWVAAIDSKTAGLFHIDGNTASLKICKLEDGEVKTEDVIGSWSLDMDTLQIKTEDGKDYNFNLDMAIDAANSENTVIALDDPANNISDVQLNQISADNEDEAITMVGNYLENAEAVEETEESGTTDYSTLLAGYEGVSIVDGLFQAGVDPSFLHRSEIAAELDIENYTGTAEQNLKMIELCGGKVK